MLELLEYKMRSFPEEKAQVIRDYNRFQLLYKSDRIKFENESKKAIQKIFDQAENEERKNNLMRLQESWDIALNR